MASKKDKNSRNSKSNKTAHVLNLITTPAQRQAAQKQADAENTPENGLPENETAAAETAAPSRPLMPPVIEVAHSQDEKIADQIRSALNSELEQLAADPGFAAAPDAPRPGSADTAPVPPGHAFEALEPVPDFVGHSNPAAESDPLAASVASALEEATPPAPPSTVPTAPPIPMSAAVAVPKTDAPPVPETVAPSVPETVAPSVPETVAPSVPGTDVPPVPETVAPPVPEPAAYMSAPSIEFEPTRPSMHGPAPSPHSGSDLVYVNIMQTIVEAMAPRYIKMFGVCSCSRCAADVKALALTNLTPKYAVFHRRDRVPMLTVYENRYGNMVATQLTKACSIVKLNPHHR